MNGASSIIIQPVPDKQCGIYQSFKRCFILQFIQLYFNVVSLVFALYLSTADAKAPPKLEPATPIKKGKEDDKAML